MNSNKEFPKRIIVALGGNGNGDESVGHGGDDRGIFDPDSRHRSEGAVDRQCDHRGEVVR